MPTSDTEVAAALDDAPRLDAIAAGLEGGLVKRLDTSVLRAQANAALDGSPTRTTELAAAGRPALWAATAALLDRLPAQRAMPWPPFERWDALLELHAANAEAAWLAAEVFAALAPSQSALARRLLVGFDRRFGARGWRALSSLAGSGPHASLLGAHSPRET